MHVLENLTHKVFVAPRRVSIVVRVVLVGYGYESYPDCPLEFSGIGNIHVSE